MPSNNYHAVISLLCIDLLVYFSKIIFTITYPLRYFFRHGITANRFGYFLGMGIQRVTGKNYGKLEQQYNNRPCKQYRQMEFQNKNTVCRRPLYCTYQ